eukprot:GGOE01053917.1.p2 GENE.GGOE01053917.1~~GGOE01053917.1.p2  ORF type:complete len:174 (+),score=26.30 GGOE01053917.1:666-1187(+)
MKSTEDGLSLPDPERDGHPLDALGENATHLTFAGVGRCGCLAELLREHVEYHSNPAYQPCPLTTKFGKLDAPCLQHDFPDGEWSDAGERNCVTQCDNVDCLSLPDLQGRRLDTLEEDAHVALTPAEFQRCTVALKRAYFRQRVKVLALLTALVVVLAVLSVLIACNPNFNRCR